MRGFVICLVLVTLSVSVSNTQKALHPYNKDNKLFVITLDGFRWEELFGGADEALISDPELTGDTALSKALYWDDQPEVRRKKLLPFLWNVVASQGQLFGNRLYGNNVNVANPYALSYPGYSELLTGRVDLTLHSNEKLVNGNGNILDQLNRTSAYRGRVAAFTSWDAFPYILNKKKSGIVLNSGQQPVEGDHLSPAERGLNIILSKPSTSREETRYDSLTFIACREYVLKKKPSVVFLSFSGTDNAGHEKQYGQYLQEANSADRMIGELWTMIQSMPEYAGRTTFLITTDHGRGRERSNWSSHGMFVPGSSQTWFALLGRSIVPAGEMKMENQTYQKDLKELMVSLLSR